jgi:hypothetical protein
MNIVILAFDGFTQDDKGFVEPLYFFVIVEATEQTPVFITDKPDAVGLLGGQFVMVTG